MSKGTRREREAVSLYQESGMGTYRPATVQYGENDVFGLFDVLAFSPRHESMHACQVKSNGAAGITAWARETALFRALGFRTFYAVPYDNAGWRWIEVESPTDWYNAVDERNHTCGMGEMVIDWLQSERAGER